METTASPRFAALIDMETLERVAPIIKNAAHPLRLRILDFLRDARAPRTVGQIVDVCPGASQAVVSQQLRILKDQGILSCRRSGNYVLYEVADTTLFLLLDCIRKHQSRS